MSMYVKQETLTVYVIYDGYEFVHLSKKVSKQATIP